MINQLVQDLPEVYQPVFGHPQLSTTASRACADRLQQIEQIYVALEKLLGRPLKVLDLGCAQGFFSLSLARRGAEVYGVDYLDKNIALCQALAKEHPSLRISFAEGRIEEVVPALQPGQYDLVLGLSVFHHLVYANGVDSVKALLEQLAEVSGALVLEMALQSEPLYWAPAQPSDPRDLIRDIGFAHLIAYHGTHLAAIPRPLFIASNRYWILGDEAEQFEQWSFESHAIANGAHNYGRRYFFGKNYILKMYRLCEANWTYNKDDFDQEIRFLKAPVHGIVTPRLVTYGQHATEAWIAMQKLPGRLLLDLIREGSAYDGRKILLAVLQQLAVLEAANLYHNDVRTWNVLVDTSSEAVHLIDYGSISETPKDCVWPSNLFLSFFIFVKEVVSGQVDNPVPLRTIAISPLSLPDPYKAWAMSFWQQPVTEWSFKKMYQSLLAWPDTCIEPMQEPQQMFIWMQAIEEGVQFQKQHTNHVTLQTQAATSQVETKAQHAETKAQHAEAKAQHAEAKAQHAEAKAQQAEAKAQHLNEQWVETRNEGAQVRAQMQQTLDLLHIAQTQMQHAFERADKAEAVSEQAQQKLQLATQDLLAVRQELHDVHQSNHHHFTQLEQTRKELHDVHQANHHHWLQVQERDQLLAAMQASKSWRVTAPLRWTFTQAKRLRAEGPKSRIKAFIKKALRKINHELLLRPALRQRVLYWSHKLGVYAKLKSLLAKAHEQPQSVFAAPQGFENSSTDLQNLSPRARQIYLDLKQAIEQQQKENH